MPRFRTKDGAAGAAIVEVPARVGRHLLGFLVSASRAGDDRAQLHYGEDHLGRLVFIRRSRNLGFSIDEIRELLGLVGFGEYACGEVKEIAVAHLGGIRKTIAELRELEKTPADVSSRCDGGAVPKCPLIDALYTASPRPSWMAQPSMDG